MTGHHTIEDRLAAARLEGIAGNLGRWLKFVQHRDENPYELQALESRAANFPCGYVGYAKTLAEGVRLLTAAEKYDCVGEYIIANPIQSAVATRIGCGKWRRATKGGTGNGDIECRRVLFIDVDAERTSRTSATDEELRCAIDVGLLIYERLAAVLEEDRALGYGHSGNGRSIFIALDSLPEEAAAPLIKAIVHALALLHDRPGAATVDRSVIDAKRLVPAWGTPKRKGESGNAERPHRQTAFACADEVRVVGLAELQMLVDTLREDLDDVGRADVDKALGRIAAPPPATVQSSRASAPRPAGDSPFHRANAIPVEQVLERLGLLVDGRPTCPGCGKDGRGVGIFENGLKCHYASCAGKGVNGRGFRTVVDLVVASKKLQPLAAVRWIADSFGLALGLDGRRHTDGGADHGEHGDAREGEPDPSELARATGVTRDATGGMADGPPCSGVRSSGPDRPSPIDPRAFYGIGGELVRLVEPHTEADPVAMLVQTLCCFGNAIGRRPHLVIEGARHAAKLFVVVVGSTSRGRKGTSLARIESFFKLAAPEWKQRCMTKAGLSSGEGLVHRLRDAEDSPDDDADVGVEDKRLLVLQSEFAAVCEMTKRQGNTLSATVREAWDDGVLGTLTKQSAEQASETHVSIIGHITREELRRRLDSTEAVNGFGNRFIFVCADRARLLPFGGREPDPTDIAERLAAAIAFAQRVDVVELDEMARERWESIYRDLADGPPGLAGALTARAAPQILRLALIYALLDSCERIKVPQLEAALAVWKFAEDSVRIIWGDTTGDEIADQILELLREIAPGGLTRTDLRDHFSRHYSKGMASALNTLVEQRLVRREERPTGGRPQQRFFAEPLRGKAPAPSGAEQHGGNDGTGRNETG